ncbi:MAG: Ribonuclease HI [Ignavibacteriae bacterium]|nr:MAG: Ribonuclease HI [Ignavibacteriota bacterium]
MNLVAYIDGASRGNPGESGIGVIIKDEKRNIIDKISGYIGKTTNNIAEYTALITCLRRVKELNLDSLTVYSDSELLVRQIQGKYKVRNARLKLLFEDVRKLLNEANFEFKIKHIDREENREADQLANAGIDSRFKIKFN